MKKRIGDLITVENKDRKFGSADKYHFLRVQDESGTEFSMLATNAEIMRMINRAGKNPEDLLKVSAIRDILD